jgi:chemotaxis protein MotB
MARKKKHPEHVNHERWLISYADFVTLLFAFFVVMFASSQVDRSKAAKVSEAFSKAMHIEILPNSGNAIMEERSTAPKPEDTITVVDGLPPELEAVKKTLVEERKKVEALTGMEIIEGENELVLRLSENVFFDSGDDKVKEVAQRAMLSVAESVRNRKVYLRVEGHTDDRPIRTSRFRSNWDLSTARSTAVINELAGRGHIEPERLSAAGYGEFHPIAPNTTPEGRSQNRRVDLVIRATEPGLVGGKKGKKVP